MIKEILNNESGKSVREKLNKVIEMLNSVQVVATSYKTLSDKPSINEKVLEGDTTLNDIGVDALIDEKITENNKAYYTGEQVAEMIQQSIDKLQGIEVDLSQFATKNEVGEKYWELYNEVVPRDLTLVEQFTGNMGAFDDGRIYFFDLVNEKPTYIYGQQFMKIIKEAIGGGTTASDRQIKQMTYTAGTTEARLIDVRGFDFDNSRVTINGVVKYPTIDYIKAGEVAIQFKDYTLELGDVVVMDGYFSS